MSLIPVYRPTVSSPPRGPKIRPVDGDMAGSLLNVNVNTPLMNDQNLDEIERSRAEAVLHGFTIQLVFNCHHINSGNVLEGL